MKRLSLLISLLLSSGAVAAPLDMPAFDAARAESQAKVSTMRQERLRQEIDCALEIYSITDDINRPNEFQVSGALLMSWSPEARPNFDPNRLKVLNREHYEPVRFGQQSVVTLSNGRKLWQGRFEQNVTVVSTKYQFFPFDTHVVPMIFQVSALLGNEGDRLLSKGGLRTRLFDVNYVPALGNPQSTLELRAVGYGTSQRQMFWDTIMNQTIYRPGGLKQGSAQGYQVLNHYTFYTRRRLLLSVLLMLLIPMGVIVVNTWFGFFWRESSPATRFGTSGILSAISLYFASRVFRPSVSYLVLTDIWFLALFGLITINNFAVTWLYRNAKFLGALDGLPRRRLELRVALASFGFTLLFPSLIAIGVVVRDRPSVQKLVSPDPWPSAIQLNVIVPTELLRAESTPVWMEAEKARP
jgi:hypothetical protein